MPDGAKLYPTGGRGALQCLPGRTLPILASIAITIYTHSRNCGEHAISEIPLSRRREPGKLGFPTFSANCFGRFVFVLNNEHAVSFLVGLDRLIEVSGAFIGGGLKKKTIAAKCPPPIKGINLNKIAVNYKTEHRTLELIHSRGC